MKTEKNISDLYKAMLLIKDEKECAKFFRDLLTEAEIKEFANRWKVARMLENKIQYTAIEKETGMSSTTIARISRWLNNGMGGYRLILNRLNSKQNNNHHAPTSLAV